MKTAESNILSSGRIDAHMAAPKKFQRKLLKKVLQNQQNQYRYETDQHTVSDQ